MAPPTPALYRQQELYWQQLVALKAGCEYTRLYRNRLQRWETRIGVVRALASSTAIAAWAVFQAHPLLWGGIIAAAQVADAVKEVIPLSGRRRATSDLLVALDALFIEALHEWESVAAGGLDNQEITDRRRKLMERRHEAEVKHLSPTGLPEQHDLLLLARTAANVYVEDMFGPRS